MSLLIEMPTFQEQPPEENMHQVLMQQVTSLLYHPEFTTAIIMKVQTNAISISLPRGQLAFVRDSRWTIEIHNNQLRIWVSLIDLTGLNYIRGQSERMKLQLMILLRFINSKLNLEEEFYVDPYSGLLRFSFIIAWKDYRQKIKGPDPLRKLIRYLLSQLHLYAEVILFCQPQSPQTQIGQPSYCPPKGLEAINRYRFLLRNTRKFRASNLGVLQQVAQLKNQLKRNPQDLNLRVKLQQLRSLFQSNILAFEQMRVGLEDPEAQELADCLKHIKKASEGQQSRTPQEYIVSGIKIIKEWQSRSISQQGAHSQVKISKFAFKLYKTINEETAVDETIWTDGRQIQGELIYKKCRIQNEHSISAFMNEICFLDHVRESHSNYIAKYYLPVKKITDRSQQDYIYMKPYFHTLQKIVTICKTFSFEQRLSIAFRLCKGLCFLTHRSILHRDFKPTNIMIDKLLNPFIIDFGSCAPIYRYNKFKVRQERLLSTPIFHVFYKQIPDEFDYVRKKFTLEEYNRHPLFDVYSFGRVLSFIFFNSYFPPNPDDISSHPCPELLKNVLFLTTLCLQIDPDERPTFAEISSFLGTLKSYITAYPHSFEQKVRSQSQSKPASTHF